MNIEKRVQVLLQLQQYLQQNNSSWQAAKAQANYKNSWFTIKFIDIAVDNICNCFLDEHKLRNWLKQYSVNENTTPKTVGVVMAGNIPLVGFHDFLCVFLSGHKMHIKASGKDDVLIKHIVEQMTEWDSEVGSFISFAETLKNCDAYIATGSNNSGRYFEYYFGKYPNIIRKNRTSVAVLTGTETSNDLKLLAKDMQLFFGQGCRNVTHLFVPHNYNFEPLLHELKQYDYFLDLHKYKHNYDYQLAMLMMNNKKYMTDGSILLSENDSIFSAISNVHYSYYASEEELKTKITGNDDIQCVVGNGFTAFGSAQTPQLNDYADGVDTMKFLTSL